MSFATLFALVVCHAFKKFLTEKEQLSAAAENRSNAGANYLSQVCQTRSFQILNI